MADPFVAEIRIFPFTFAPKGWAFCDGQLMPLSQNTALFALLGTVYGGDGKSTFALPDLQDSAPVGAGTSAFGTGLSERFLGEMGGTPFVTLLQSEMPIHTHALSVSASDALVRVPEGELLAQATGIGLYANEAGAPLVALHPVTYGLAGGDLPHNNMQPFLTFNFCIALQGVFPRRN